MPLEELKKRQFRIPHQILIHGMSRAAAFADGPDDEALAAAHVAGGEDAVEGCHIISVDLHVAAGVFLEAKLVNWAGVLGADEALRKQAQIAIERQLAHGEFLHLIEAG